MSKHILIKLVCLILCVITVLSVSACNGVQSEETTQSTDIPNIENTDDTDESETNSDTDDITEDSNEQSEYSTSNEDESETACYHEYSATLEGHFKDACDVCGKAAGRVQNHEIAEKIKDQGDRLLYMYYCQICEYVVYRQELSYDINVYIPPTDLAATRCYNYSPKYYFEDGIGFTRFTSSGASNGGIIYVYEDSACEDVSGRYLVMKARLTNPGSINLEIKSSNGVKSKSVTPCEISDSWGTLIIDLSKVTDSSKNGYMPDGGGDYFLELLNINLTGGSSLARDEYLDISYITIVETLEDAIEFAKNDVRLIYNNVLMNPFPTVEGELCKHAYTFDDKTHSSDACDVCGAEAISGQSHDPIENLADTEYTYTCRCGYKYDTKKDVPESVDLFLSPSFIAKHANSQNFFTSGTLMVDDDGEVYARILGREKNAYGYEITDSLKWWNVYSNGYTVTGKYLVIKYRIGQNGLGQSQLRMYLSTTRSGAVDETDGFGLAVKEDNQWHVAVIDLSKAHGNSSSSTFTPADDGTYTLKFLQIRPFTNAVANENDYNDIAYIAFCDNIEDVKDIVSEESYYWQDTKGIGTGKMVDKATGPVIEETESETETEPEVLENDHIITEIKNGDTYSYTCSHCDIDLNSINVPSSINKFYSPTALYASGGFQAVKTLLTSDSGDIFTRIGGSGGKAFEFYFVNRQSSPATDAGAFRYMVFRVRASNASKHINVVFKINDVETSIRINNSMVSGEWATIVIDMDKINKISPNADGSYKITHFFIYTQALEAEHVDLSYVALCDNWDEVAPLCTDETVTLVTHKENKGGIVSAADGACSAHTPTETISGSTYTYACANCGTVISARTIPESTNLFLSSNSIKSTYATKHEFMAEDGVVFRRYTTTAGGAHIYVRDAAALADSGKLLIIKMRVSSEMTAFVLSAGANELSSVEQNPPQKKGTWRTVVIDLAQFAKYNVNAENGNVQIRFTIYGAAPGYTFDIAYVAIVDDRAEARAIIDDETYDYYSNWKSTPVTVETASENCSTCLVTENVNGNTYSYSDCAICGRTFADASKTVSPDVAKYYSAGQLAAMSKYNASVTLMADASGEAFARIKSNNGNAYEYYVVNKSGAPATSIGESVRYVLFKVRMTNVPLECKFSLSASGGGGGVLYFSLSVTQKDEWVTVVADMDAISKLMPGSEGKIDIKYFYMYTGATGAEALDISTIAFCNSWDEIASISGSDTAMLMTVQNAKGTLVSTVDGSTITQ